ncbi:hypothetical protein RIF29_20830 [Crotalaria pallida]|uniref:Exocyst complex component Sec3 PIP2-binding N-terminal domain-containing protein n=1 Tax=Crotalaria pallida TaxID=3830 RepID=A0AAN9FAE6_CROPI
MAKSSADDAELRRACEAAIEGTKQKIVLSIRVVKTHGTWGKTTKLGRQMAKPRVLAISIKQKVQRTKAFLRVLKYSNGGVLEPAKIYKLKHLSKVEVVTNDPSGCTFTLGFDNLRSHTVAPPPQWTMRNVDDRNRLLFSILNICKDVLGRLPKVVGIDVVEMALWAKENTPKVSTKNKQQDDGPVESATTEVELKVNVEKDLVSQAEEEDMEALLGTYVMGIGEAEAFSERLKRELQALEAANVHAILESEPLIDEVLQGLEVATNCVEDVGEWLGMFNVKLRHMREDIESIEIRNNKLEMQSVNQRSLIVELDKLLEPLSIPSEYSTCLTGDSFDDPKKLQNVCEWLISAMQGLEVPNIDPTFAKMRAVKEKRGELQILKSTFVRKASEFLRNYFASFTEFMMNDKSYFSQRGQLKRPDHADLRFNCRTYAGLLQYLKILDKNCLGPLRKDYCCSLNLLLRREAREFSNELRASTKTPRNATIWLEGSTGSGQSPSPADTSAVSDAYGHMLRIFIPLLVDEHFFNFPGQKTVDLVALNEALQDLHDGVQEDFYAVVDWAYKIDPLCCISMHGLTERYLSGQKADAAGFVRLLLGDLESRISVQFSHYVDEACQQIERHERTVRQTGVLGYIPRFASLATRMEQYIKGQSRDLVDQAYTKFVPTQRKLNLSNASTPVHLNEAETSYQPTNPIDKSLKLLGSDNNMKEKIEALLVDRVSPTLQTPAINEEKSQPKIQTPPAKIDRHKNKNVVEEGEWLIVGKRNTKQKVPEKMIAKDQKEANTKHLIKGKEKMNKTPNEAVGK